MPVPLVRHFVAEGLVLQINHALRREGKMILAVSTGRRGLPARGAETREPMQHSHEPWVPQSSHISCLLGGNSFKPSYSFCHPGPEGPDQIPSAGRVQLGHNWENRGSGNGLGSSNATS